MKRILVLGIALILFGSVVQAKKPIPSTTSYFSYSHNIQCNVSEIATPYNVYGVQMLVQHAIKEKLKIKAVGSHHSTTDAICPGGDNGVAISMKNINYVRISKNKKYATLGAGLTVHEASMALDSKGLSFIHIPAFLGITIGGALGTGAHGSSVVHPSSLSDQLFSITVVTGDGKIRTIMGEELNIFRVSLGLLGIIVDATFHVVPQFKLTITNQPFGENIFFDGTVEKMARSGKDFFQAWWFPGSKSAVISTGKQVLKGISGDDHWTLIPNSTPSATKQLVLAYEQISDSHNTTALCQIEDFAAGIVAGKLPSNPIFTNSSGTSNDNPATGKMFQMVAADCTQCLWTGPGIFVSLTEIAVSIPLKYFTAAMKDMEAILAKYPTCFSYSGVFTRFVSPSRGIISTDYGDELRAHVEIVTERRLDIHKPRLGLVTLQEIEQMLLFKYHGRPHWGKNNIAAFSPPIPQIVHPNIDRFSREIERYDPHGIFQNPFSARVFHGKPGPRFPYCALESACYCKTDDECGKATTGLSCKLDGSFKICA